MAARQSPAFLSVLAHKSLYDVLVSAMPDSHDINERVRLLSHAHYARIVVGDRTLLKVASDAIDSAIADGTDSAGQRLWHSILQRPWPHVREQMLRDGADGRLLRSNSPFSIVIGIADEQRRRAMWRKAKSELSARRTWNAQSAA